MTTNYELEDIDLSDELHEKPHERHDRMKRDKKARAKRSFRKDTAINKWNNELHGNI